MPPAETPHNKDSDFQNARYRQIEIGIFIDYTHNNEWFKPIAAGQDATHIIRVSLLKCIENRNRTQMFLKVPLSQDYKHIL
jgi:hypothetical protein